ncbi:Pyranose 2-oxidase [Cerrena zonata]|uniref:Pyranose 2-oxidase n=1 Tax=Cerrena zonata TaxID=2478898 RepID=A0AAW0FVM2_9APHY
MANTNPNFHPRYQDIDVFIAGSGPIGSTFAKKCVDAGLRVLMCEIGAADSFTSKPLKGHHAPTSHDETYSANFEPGYIKVPGYHKKNEIEYQKDIDRFVKYGALSTVSIPTNNTSIPTLDPASFQNSQERPFVSLGKNPIQNPFENLGAEAVTRGVGGMSTHWTCSTPRFNPYVERPKLDENPKKDDEIWENLYAQAEKVLGSSNKEFDESIRHNLVLKTLQKEYKNKGRVFKPLTLACHRLDDPDYVEWHAADRILEDLFTDPAKREKFTLLTNHRCTRVIIREDAHGKGKHTIVGAEVTNLLPKTAHNLHSDTTFAIRAKTYVVAAGAVATAQILANSQKADINIEPIEGGDDRITIDTRLTPNLARYITEQPMTFCQIVMDESLIKSVDKNPFNLPWWPAKVAAHTKRHPRDPIHIPFRDPEPQVTTPFSKEHPWHTQIHRDAFSYGAVAETIDTRLIVDLRFFGYVEPRKENRIVFQQFYEDAYDMPQPTFRFQMSDDDKARSRAMMADMCDVALKLGGYLPDSQPQFMTPGLALHLAGTVRAGPTKKDHVADTHCKVYDFDNLYVGGNGVIPTGFGANPTLTSICYALRASEHIIASLKKR